MSVITQTAGKALAAPLRALGETRFMRILSIVVGALMMGALIALAVTLLPGFLLAIGLWVTAWGRAWEAARLRNWAIGLGGGYLVATMVLNGSVWAPFTAFGTGVSLAWNGQFGAGLVETSAIFVPVGLLLSALAWARYRDRMQSGKARTLEWGERHEQRQRRRRSLRASKAAQRHPAPLVTPDKKAVIIGPASDETRGVTRGLAGQLAARHPHWITVPMTSLGQHTVSVGDSGSGKSTLLRRLSLAWTEAAWHDYAAGRGAHPLTFFVNCKGGPAAQEEGNNWAHDLACMGLAAARCGVWPHTARLNIWTMKSRDLQSCLQSMIRSSHEHFDQLRESLLHLVIDAPNRNNPRSSVEFLQRIDPEWLAAAWRRFPIESRMVEAVCAGREPAWQDAILKYSNLFRQLGVMFDAGNDIGAFDALYCDIAGTRRPAEAQAQATGIVQLINDLLHREKRRVFIVLDEYSAVSGGVGIGIVDAVERWRSLGGEVLVAGQSWQGMGDTDDERSRLVNTCSGGRFLLRSTDSEKLSMVSGTMRRVEPSRHIKDKATGSDGAARVQDTFTVNPQRIREMQPGDIAYAAGGGAVWGRVSLVPKLQPPKTPFPEVRAALLPAPAVSRIALASGIAVERDRAQGGSDPEASKAAEAAGGPTWSQFEDGTPLPPEPDEGGEW